MKDKGRPLPPRPWEGRQPEAKKETPVAVYINGQPVKMTKLEALGIITQITQTLIYLEANAPEEGEE